MEISGWPTQGWHICSGRLRCWKSCFFSTSRWWEFLWGWASLPWSPPPCCSWLPRVSSVVSANPVRARRKIMTHQPPKLSSFLSTRHTCLGYNVRAHSDKAPLSDLASFLLAKLWKCLCPHFELACPPSAPEKNMCSCGQSPGCCGTGQHLWNMLESFLAAGEEQIQMHFIVQRVCLDGTSSSQMDEGWLVTCSVVEKLESCVGLGPM